jgi:hypothetical protein
MDLFRLKLIFGLLAFGLIAGAVAGALLHYAFPQFYPDWYLGIVFFFLILETLLVGFVASKSLSASPKQMVNVYLLAKVVKMLAALAFIALYALTVKERITNFVLVFAIFYALYLIVETYLYAKIEKKSKI